MREEREGSDQQYGKEGLLDIRKRGRGKITKEK